MTDSELKQRQQWTIEQEKLKQKLCLDDSSLSFGVDAAFEGLSLIGGVDISFMDAGQNTTQTGFAQRALACVVVLAYPSLDIVYEHFLDTELHLPYIAGFLAFREAPPLLELCQTIPKQYQPQIIFVDGNGRLHPRAFGLACHLGVMLDIPTIGVGKNFLEIHENGDTSTREDSNLLLTMAVVKQRARMELQSAGAHFKLTGPSGVVYGAAVRPLTSTSNPIFVSVGHRCSLSTAIKLCFKVTKFRIPEPIRQADIRSRERLRSSKK